MINTADELAEGRPFGGSPSGFASNAAVINLHFFLSVVRELPTSESEDISGTPDGRPAGFCLSTASDSASENWAFIPGGPSSAEETDAVRRFFHDRGLPFVWPMLPDARGAELLTEAGLRDAGHIAAMELSLKNFTPRFKGSEQFSRFVSSDAEAEEWAEISWAGFGGEDGAPRPFIESAKAMYRREELRLGIAFRGGEPAGTFLTAAPAKGARSTLSSCVGVYYFAVLPKFRRLGAASAMMDDICRTAADAGRSSIVLQSTPAGLPFYTNFGFRNLFDIALFSDSDDVF